MISFIIKLLCIFAIDDPSFKLKKNLVWLYSEIVFTNYCPIKNVSKKISIRAGQGVFTHLNKEDSLMLGDPDQRIYVLWTSTAFMKHCYMGVLLGTTISLEMLGLFLFSFLLRPPWSKGNNAHLVSKSEHGFQLHLHSACLNHAGSQSAWNSRAYFLKIQHYITLKLTLFFLSCLRSTPDQLLMSTCWEKWCLAQWQWVTKAPP